MRFFIAFHISCFLSLLRLVKKKLIGQNAMLLIPYAISNTALSLTLILTLILTVVCCHQMSVSHRFNESDSPRRRFDV